MPTYEDLGDPDVIATEDYDHVPDGYEDEGSVEDDLTSDLSEEDAAFLDELIKRTILFCETITGVTLRPYQVPLAYRIIESIILADAEVVTATFSRQCLDGDTLVFRRDGTPVRLREHEDAWSTGVRPTQRYKVHGGAEIVATDNHPVWTPEGWVPAGDLKVGDQVAVVQEWDRWADSTLSGTDGWDLDTYLNQVSDTADFFVEDLDGEIMAFRRIVNIEDAGEREVFDVRYSGKGWFVAQGVKVHNSGKSEVVSTIVAGIVVLFPRLAHVYTILERFKGGVWVGVFAPVDGQSEFVFGRISDKLNTDVAKEIMQDPEIDEYLKPNSKILKFKSGSLIRRQTANPKAKVEGATYHLVIIDEAQDAADTVVSKSISPMLASTAGTTVKIGTPGFYKGNYYRDIQYNKRRALVGRRAKVNHFEADWKVVAKHNPFYERFIQKEKLRIGEDSDEFLMSYCVAPDTKILTADLRHIPASQVTKGMTLLGFDEETPGRGLHRKFKDSVVEDVAEITRPCYRVNLSDGRSLVCSAEHQWLVFTAGSRTEWMQTQDLMTPRHPTRVGRPRRLFQITDVWEEADSSFERGYLSAAFDGEGSFSGAKDKSLSMLQFSQRENGRLDRVRKYLAEFGFTWWETTTNGTNGDVVSLHIAGGRAALMRFLGQIRPERLLEKVDSSRWGSIGRHDHKTQQFSHPEVEGIEFLGEQPVIAIRTSTHTFIADGLASHNCLKWILDRGMLITEDSLDYLADQSMGLVRGWHRSRCVAGIDPARLKDSTVVTVCWVDWEHPDPAGYCEIRVLNWLEINNADWEDQYQQICDFLDNYDLLRVGVDAQGMGGPVAERLRRLLGHRCEVVSVGSDLKAQDERWKHLIQLLQRNLIIYPGHSKARRTRVWKRFRQQMEDAEKQIKGQYMLVSAPQDARSANDDYTDSLALACLMTLEDSIPVVETMDAPWYR